MNDTLANTEKKTAYILTLPAVLLVFAIILFPIFANVWISFKEVELDAAQFNEVWKLFGEDETLPEIT